MLLAMAWLPMTPAALGQRGAAPSGLSEHVKSKPHYAFDPSDTIRGHLGTLKSEYYVGEPVMIPLVLINHTVHPITLRTNFNPRSALMIMITRENQVPQQYFGPYPPGFYAPLEPPLDPMEEFSTRILIWGDANSDSGLAFPEPGIYTVSIAIKLEVPEASFISQPKFAPIQIKVVPTPPEVAPLVEDLKKYRAFIPIHFRNLPKGHEERIIELIQQYPNTPLTPYMAYSVYASLLDKYNLHPEDKTLADRMLYYLQIATVPVTSFQIEGLNSLLSIFNDMGLAVPAEAAARRLIQNMPRDMIGLAGSNKVMQKYLINAKELDAGKNWVFFQ